MNEINHAKRNSTGDSCSLPPSPEEIRWGSIMQKKRLWACKHQQEERVVSQRAKFRWVLIHHQEEPFGTFTSVRTFSAGESWSYQEEDSGSGCWDEEWYGWWREICLTHHYPLLPEILICSLYHPPARDGRDPKDPTLCKFRQPSSSAHQAGTTFDWSLHAAPPCQDEMRAETTLSIQTLNGKSIECPALVNWVNRDSHCILMGS